MGELSQQCMGCHLIAVGVADHTTVSGRGTVPALTAAGLRWLSPTATLCLISCATATKDLGTAELGATQILTWHAPPLPLHPLVQSHTIRTHSM